MKRISKLLILPMMLLVCGVVLAACGGGNKPTPGVTSVTVAPATHTLTTAGSTVDLTATVVVTGGAAQTVTWSSSNDAFATVNASGTVTAVANGVATITATSTADTTKTGTSTVTVNIASDQTPGVTSVNVAPLTHTLTAAGATVQLTPTVVVTGGAAQTVTWSSSNDAFATVSTSGLVTAVANGIATITATSTVDTSKKGEATITVNIPAVPLSAPTGLAISENMVLSWNSVAGAASYLVDIDGVTAPAATTSYSLESFATEHGVYQIRVKAIAPGGSTTHTDSNFSAATSFEPAGFIFNSEANSPLRITGLTNFGKTLQDIVIPEQIAGANVTAIGSGAFQGNTVMVSVTISVTITFVGDNAFAGVTTLTDVTFLRDSTLGITELGDGVFTGATNIENINVPANSVDDYKAELPPELSDKVDEITKTTQQLTAPTLGFVNATGIVFFNAVSHANGYTFLINDTAQTPTWSAANNRYEFQLTAFGAFTAKVTALGHETATHIYTNSTQATHSGNYTKPQSQLTAPTLGFDNATGIVFFNGVTSGITYTLLINDTQQTATWVTARNRFEFQLTTFGAFTAKVTANGHETANHIYTSSTQATFNGNYTKPQSQLVMPVIGFDNETGIVFFNAVANAQSGASGYVLLINDTARTPVWNAARNRFEFQLTAYGAFTAKVTALQNETANHIYLASSQATFNGNYTQAVTQYTLTVVNGTGTITVNAGTQVTATATVPSGQVFVRWLENGTQVSTQNPWTFPLNANRTLTAVFEDEGKPTQQLATPTLGHEDGVVYFLPVDNAIGYQFSLKIHFNANSYFEFYNIDGGLEIHYRYFNTDTRVTFPNDRYGDALEWNEQENRWQFFSGWLRKFTLEVTALGQETATHIYTDSNKAVLEDTKFQIQSHDGKIRTHVDVPIVGNDRGVIWFTRVENAGSYSFLIYGPNHWGHMGPGNIPFSASWNSETQRYEYRGLISWGNYEVRIMANFGSDTATHSFINSGLVRFDFTYQAPQYHTITTNVGIENGLINTFDDTGNQTMFEAGSTVTIVVMPDGGYRLVAGSLGYFPGYVDNGNFIATGAFVPLAGNTFVMPAFDIKIVAQFERDPDAQKFNITIGQSLEGKIFADSNAYAGQRVFISTAHGIVIVSLSINGVTAENHGGSWSFIMPGHAVIISGTVAQLTVFDIIIGQGLEGKISTAHKSAPEGSHVSIWAEHGYVILTLFVDGSQIFYDYGWHFTMPAHAVTITGTAQELPRFNITVHADLVGKIDVNTWALEGDEVWIHVRGNVTNLLVNGGAIEIRQVGRNAFSFTMPAGHVTITGTVVQFDEYIAEVEFDVTGTLVINEANETMTLELMGEVFSGQYTSGGANVFVLTIVDGNEETKITATRTGTTVAVKIEFSYLGTIEETFNLVFTYSAGSYVFADTMTETYAIRLFEDESFQLLVEWGMGGDGPSGPVGGGDDFFPIVSGTYVISGTTITFTFPIYCDDTGNEIGVGTMIGTIGGNNIIIDLALPANEAAANALGFPPIVITFEK